MDQAHHKRLFTVCRNNLTQKPQMLRGYLIRLTREYTDGGMDSHAEEERDNSNELLAATVIKSIKLILCANVRSAVRVFTGEAGVIRQPPDALIAVFALKHEATFSTNREEPHKQEGYNTFQDTIMNLQCKPDFDNALRRIEAWFAHEPTDRPPVRFGLHNAEFNHGPVGTARWKSLKDRWFDAEYQVDSFLSAIQGRVFRAETFPVFWPNLGPNVYAAYHGAELDYGEVTSWVQHCVHEWPDLERLAFSRENDYFKKIDQLTAVALQKCQGQFMVGYTDLHGSLDCVADWRDPQALCMDLLDCPDEVTKAVTKADAHFLPIFDYYDDLLKRHGQLSVTWMGIPSRGMMHIPSCDFTSMVSPDDFDRFYLPSLQKELRHMTHNIFHLDGKGILRHLDRILEQPEIHAVQWVQGVGDDLPIMQWLDVIRKIQAAGKGVVVDLSLDELEPFMAVMKPDGLYLCLAVEDSLQLDVLKRLEKW